MEYIKFDIEGIILLKPDIHNDPRGYFFESYVKRDFDNFLGHSIDFVQDNESSSRYGVVRGLHFQTGSAAQAKLVSCARGRVLDVALDIRPNSPSFGRHIAVELSDERHEMLFIPRGFAHGFAVLSSDAVFRYKCDNYYCPEKEAGICAFDPGLGIDWKIPNDKIIRSKKDLMWPSLYDYSKLMK